MLAIADGSRFASCSARAFSNSGRAAAYWAARWWALSQAAIALGELGLARLEHLLTGPERLLEQRLGLGMERELSVDVAEQGLHLSLQPGLARQLLVDPRRAAVEEIARRQALALGAIGIGEQEDVGQKALRRLGAAGLAAGHVRLPERRAGAAEDGKEGEGRRRDPAAVAAHELAHAVGGGVGAGEDRAAREVALEVVAQRRRRGVAAAGFAVQRLEHDRVDVALEAPRRGLGAVGGYRSRPPAQRGARPFHGLARGERDDLREVGAVALVR